MSAPVPASCGNTSADMGTTSQSPKPKVPLAILTLPPAVAVKDAIAPHALDAPDTSITVAAAAAANAVTATAAANAANANADHDPPAPRQGAGDGGGGGGDDGDDDDDDELSRKLSFSGAEEEEGKQQHAPTQSGPVSAPVPPPEEADTGSAKPKRTSWDASAEYDNAYTNFGANKDVHRWACVGTLEEVRQHVVEPRRTNELDDNGWGCLHFACYASRTEVVRLLLKDGYVEVDAQTRNGETALHIVCRAGNTEVFQMLLDHGADAYIKNSRGKLAHQLSRGENASIFRTLAESTEPKKKVPSKQQQQQQQQASTTKKHKTPGPELVGRWILVEYDEEVSDESDSGDAMDSSQQVGGALSCSVHLLIHSPPLASAPMHVHISREQAHAL
jgi:hypothetical protein